MPSRQLAVRIEALAPLHETRVPMPAPAAIRPSRRFFLSPSVLFGRGRCGRYSATASAASSMVAKPSCRMRAHEALHLGNALVIDARRDIDQNQRRQHMLAAVAEGSRLLPALTRHRPAMRRSQPACSPCWRVQFGSDGLHVARKIAERIGPVRYPFGIAMTTLIDRVGSPAPPREFSRRRPPCVARLAAAMQQHYRRSLVPEDIADEPIAVCAGKARRWPA